MRTIASETARLGLVEFKQVDTKRELTWKNHEVPCVIPPGTKVTLYWSTNNPSRVYLEYAGHLRAVRTKNMKDNFIGKFKKMPSLTTLQKKMPSLTTLQKWEWQGRYCETVLGEKTEPDGYGPSGAPSWMLVMGVI